ncbi:hypothetical protein QBC47DRAFT_309110 [Echria macrotheca]|uniref:Uncharacterized protein n=1 Tax=Echria macrotheca TaxID=438768 RepID=A0AAJ0B5U0_9PEZI|nr:hypothetical protein QBC47DRAFT_309110 [Echria macrotheca]
MDSPILKRLFPLSPSVLHSHPTTLNAAFPPRSHDSSSVGYHVTQSELTRNLDLAVQAAWAARHSSRYVDVKVLLMSWASDDLGVKDEVQVLESVFRDLYNFDVENWTIPDEEPGLEAASKVLEFVKTGRHPDNLLILYYAGHALQSPNGGLPTWIANRSDDSPKFDSGCVQPHFCHGTEGSPDALLLYDSCHPANGHGSIKSGRPVIELLAACGFESTAAEVGRDSFTNSLIQELSHAASERRCISVPELHRRQICRLQSWAPSVSTGRDPRGNLKVAVGPDGSPILDVPRRRTPIHCQLSLNSRPRAIVLSPLPRSKGGPDFIQLDHVQKPADKNNPPELQVLLKVSIIEDKFNEADFKDWLCAAPPAAKEIKILGVLPSCSTLLLLRVPIEVWDMLSPSPAISFIGFVVSDTADPTESGGPSIPSAPSCLSTIDGNDSSGESEQTEYSVNFAQTDDEKSLIEVLNSIDELLPSVFRRIRNKESLLNRENEEILVTDGVIGELQGLGTSSPVPLGGGTEFSENMRVSDNIGQKIYIGFRKFIVVANDEGHCTCVPILTYERRGCTKSGVRASQHGIVYPVGGRAVMLKNEPRLGFPPIRIQLDGARARNEISKESRVNYSKLCTVEHNTRVVFIGRIVPQDFDIVQAAVDDCWEAKARSAGSKLRRKTTPDE